MFSANNTQGFTFHFVPVTQNALSYLWDFGDGNFSAAPSPIYTYQNKGLYNVCLQLNDNCGHTDTCIDVLASLIGLEENALGNTYFVYPNPASTQLHVANLPVGVDVTYQIVNALGVAVLRGKVSAENAINTTQLPQGAYVLKLEEGGHYFTRKFEIVR
jgi:hypothetical protein